MAELEIRRRNQAGTAVPWTLAEDADSPTGVADPSADHAARATLAQILTALGDQLTAGDEVALSAAQIAALQQIDVQNWPATFPDGHTQPLTDTQLRATPVPVSGDFTVTLPDDYPLPAGQVTTLTPQTDALTDTELRASAVATDVQPRIPDVPLTAVATLSSAGTSELIAAPGAGKALRVHYVTFTPAADPTIVTVQFAGGAPLLRGAAAGKGWLWTGADNEALQAVLTDARTVAFTVLYEEVTL